MLPDKIMSKGLPDLKGSDQSYEPGQFESVALKLAKENGLTSIEK